MLLKRLLFSALLADTPSASSRLRGHSASRAIMLLQQFQQFATIEAHYRPDKIKSPILARPARGYDIFATPDRYLASGSIRPPSRQIWTLKDRACDAGHRPEEDGVGKTGEIANNSAPLYVADSDHRER
jgi:hypothetical protein